MPPIVCEAFDNPEAKAMLVNGILEHFPEKKLVSATGMAGYGSSNTIITEDNEELLSVRRRRDSTNLWKWTDGTASGHLCST